MKRFTRLMAGGIAATMAAAGITLISGGTALAATGVLQISPATGFDNDNLTFNTPQACTADPNDTNIQVSLTGGNSGGSYGLLPNSSQSAYTANSSGGLTLPAVSTIQQIAGGNGFSVAGQTYNITAICRRSGGSAVFDTFTNTITFGAQQGSVTPYTTPVTSTATSVTLAPATASITTAGSQVLTATVTPSAATGSVEFDQGATVLGTVPVSAGSASYTYSNGTPGTYNVTAKLIGTGSYANSAPSAASAITVTQAAATPTSQVLTVNGGSTASVQQSSAVTFSDTVTPTAAAGTVTFLQGTTVLATVTPTSGVATYVTSSLPVGGPYSITAHFAPTNTTSYVASDSNAVTVTITASTYAPDPQTIDVVVAPGTLTITTPYDGSSAAKTFHLGTMTLDPTATFLSASGVFGDSTHGYITVTDTRAGALPWTAKISAAPLSDGASHTIAASGLGLTGIAASTLSGTGTVTTTDIPAKNPSGAAPTGPGLSATPQTFATDTHGPGTVNMSGVLSLYAPTSTVAGTYTGIVTFTIS